MENYEDVITVENELHAIVFILDDEPTKDSKSMGKRIQASMSRDKDKEPFDLEGLNHLVNTLSNEMENLKHRSSETTMSNKPPKLNIFRRTLTSTSSSNQPKNSMHNSNVVLNIEKLGTDQYCSYHQEKNSEKTCP